MLETYLQEISRMFCGSLTQEELTDPDKPMVTRVLQGISFEGNAESFIGRGTLYATSTYKHSKDKQGLRHDFVVIQIENEQGELETNIAQILCIFELALSKSDILSIYAVVQYLKPHIKKTPGIRALNFEKYDPPL
jgi:hypothetical protein